MRTTLDLPEDLVKEAMAASHTSTKTSAIIYALNEVIRKSKISDLKQYKGKVDLDINLDDLRARNE